MTLRSQLHQQLDPRAWLRRGLSPLNVIVAAAILLSTCAAILETEPLIASSRQGIFNALEFGFGLLFLLEYVARIWIAPEGVKDQSNFKARIHFILSAPGLIDLVATAVTLIPLLGLNALPLRLLRLLRMFRLAKLGRMSSAMTRVLTAVRSRCYELSVTIMFALVVIVFGSSALYWLEGEIQQDQFGSIPRAMWWAVVTLTTIGYGDVYPISPAGKFVAAIVAAAGIGLIAMPTGILAAAFSEAMQAEEE